MKMPADLFGLCHHADQVVRKILRMRGHEADTLQSFDLLNLLQQFCKGHRLLQILSIRIDILPQQHDFHHTVFYKSFNLTDDILRFPASLPAAHIGYNTVAAEIIAAKHNINAGLERIFTLNRKIFHDLVRIFPDVNDHSVRLQC